MPPLRRPIEPRGHARNPCRKGLAIGLGLTRTICARGFQNQQIQTKSKELHVVSNTKRPGRGGARPGAGRPKGSKTRKLIEVSGAVDPVLVLEQIAADASAPASARVQAAKALLARSAPAPQKDGAPERLIRDLNSKALALLSAKGHA
jgi:hypothetical protein